MLKKTKQTSGDNGVNVIANSKSKVSVNKGKPSNNKVIVAAWIGFAGALIAALIIGLLTG